MELEMELLLLLLLPILPLLLAKGQKCSSKLNRMEDRMLSCRNEEEDGDPTAAADFIRLIFLSSCCFFRRALVGVSTG
jgi:hypothetical protein